MIPMIFCPTSITADDRIFKLIFLTLIYKIACTLSMTAGDVGHCSLSMTPSDIIFLPLSLAACVILFILSTMDR